MEIFNTKSFTLFCILFSHTTIFGMEFEKLKEQLDKEFFKAAPANNEPQKQTSVDDISLDDFLEAVRKNDNPLVERCLRNRVFKEKIDFHTLISAYTIAKNNNSAALQCGISGTLKKIFPRHFTTITKEEETKFLSVFDGNNSYDINQFLNNNEFLDKAPIYVLRAAQLKARNKGKKELCTQIRSIITQNKSWQD